MRSIGRLVLLGLLPALGAVAGGPDASALDVLTTTTTATEPTTTTVESTTTTVESTSTTVESATTTTTASTTTTSADGGGGSGLTISLPSSVDLSSGTSVAAGSVTAQLGTVTVTDSRGGLLSPTSWTATVTATAFVNEAVPSQSVPSTNVAYWSGPATGGSGLAVATPGQPTGVLPPNLAGPVTAFSSTGNTGTSSVSWNPTLVIAIPAGAGEGQYRGTITHSVG